MGGSQSRLMGVGAGVEGRDGVGAGVHGGAVGVLVFWWVFADESEAGLSTTGVGGGALTEGLADA